MKRVETMSTENTRIEKPITDSPNIPEDRMQETIARRAEKRIPQMENREEKLSHLDDCCRLLIFLVCRVSSRDKLGRTFVIS